MPTFSPTSTTEATWKHEQVERPDKVVARMLTLAHERGVALSPSRASRLVRGQIRRERMTKSERSLIGFVLPYADPTGETAARNIDRGRNARA